MPSNSTKTNSFGSSSRRKANSIPKAKPLVASRPAQSYLVVDATLPSHIINNCSLFTTYMPGRKVHRTAFGHDIIIEGTRDAHIWVFAAGQYICFRMRNCWHVPSLPHNFLSWTTITSSGHQVMITARTPRIPFPNNRRLAEPRLPKYVPLTKIDGYWVLRFEIPAQGSISSQLLSTTTRIAAQDAISLYAFTYQPFAALSLPVHTNPSPLASEAMAAAGANGHTNVMSNTSTGDGLHGGANGLVGDVLKNDVLFTSHGGAGDQITMPVVMTLADILNGDAKDQAATPCKGPNDLVKTDSSYGPLATLNSSLYSFDPDLEDSEAGTGSFPLHLFTFYTHHHFPLACTCTSESSFIFIYFESLFSIVFFL